MPWKNGGGTTTEIAVHPPGATVADFAWRVSMAPVVADGWFSEFPGVERSLAILQGTGIRLIQNGTTVALTGTTPPHRFPADVPTDARLTNGPILDLNVMTRRGNFTHRMRALQIVTETQLNLTAATNLVFCPTAALRLTQGDNSLTLPAMDTAMLESGPLRITARAPTQVYLIEINPPI